MTKRAPLALTILSALAATACAAAQDTPAGATAPLFAGVWIGGPLDSIYNAEYPRVQAACRGEGDACHERELDTTAVRLAPVFARPAATEPVGWLVARLRPRGAWPYAGLLFVGVDGVEVPLIDDLGDWGYGTTLDLVEARDDWVRPWLLARAGAYWLGPEQAPGLGVVEGPFGLEERIWSFGPLSASEAGNETEIPAGEYMVLEVRDGTVRFRPEIPTDMDCGEPIDSVAAAAPVPIYEVPVSRLLDTTGRPVVEVAYGKGC